MQHLFDLSKALIKATDTDFVRYLHSQIEWDARMIAIVGARGVGKTTMLLQHIKMNVPEQDTLFVYADDLYFSDNSLYDTASTFYRNGGKRFYIDEVHKYKTWSQELKMMYDHFPNLQIVFTGSSILDIYKAISDLSRRALVYNLAGMSFREYVNISQKLNLPVYSLDQILANKVEIPNIEKPLVLFNEYLKQGYYPFYSDKAYAMRLQQMLNLILESDIPIFANMNVASSKKLRQLLYIISQSVPFKPNFSKIATMLDIHRNTVADFIYYLEKAGVISQLRDNTLGLRSLGKVEKLYLANTNLVYALSADGANIGNIRETFFYSMMNVNTEIASSKIADFSIGKFTFEVGGKNKQQHQIEGVDNAYIVKDDIEYGYMNIIPLWNFGFNY